MKTSVYSTCFGLSTPRGSSFDVTDALANWAVYADEISVAVGDNESHAILNAAAYTLGVESKVRVTRTSFSFTDDPFAYGKTENAALQACTGDLLIQQNLDERLRADKEKLGDLHRVLATTSDLKAFWVPTIDLYGDVTRCLPTISRKWYIHAGGLKRGPVPFGIKADGRVDYNRSSTDELLSQDDQLVPTAALMSEYTLEQLRPYVAAGWPVSYHLGYSSFSDRIERSRWWKAFWETHTGDPNQHPTEIAQMAMRQTVEHGLPLWPTIATS